MTQVTEVNDFPVPFFIRAHPRTHKRDTETASLQSLGHYWRAPHTHPSEWLLCVGRNTPKEIDMIQPKSIYRGLLEALAQPWAEDSYRTFEGTFKGRRRYHCSDHFYRRDGRDHPMIGFTHAEVAAMVAAGMLTGASRNIASGIAVNEHAMHALADFARDAYDAWRLSQERIAAACEARRLWGGGKRCSLTTRTTRDETTIEKREKPWQFRPGNPGRPKGSKHRTTLAIEALFGRPGRGTHSEGDRNGPVGRRRRHAPVLDRLVPPRRDRHIALDLPPVRTAADATAASGAIVDAVGAGDITPSEGAEVSKILDVHVRNLEAREFEERLAKLEQESNR